MPTTTTTYSDSVACVPRAGTLYDVIEIILDRGMVIDVFVRVSLVGIEILKVDARVVVASVDTYLRFAEACNRLDLESDPRSRTVPELFSGGGGGSLTGVGARKAVSAVGRKVEEAIGGREDEQEDEQEGEEAEEEPRRPRARKRTTTARSATTARRKREG
ncbi:gas vesicle protein GvpJ [Streptomyces sp. JJ36]|uniref:gas vesicle protein GvpJ n=1 Tax=Streptomyces sp. JJ36 TaxID=2736645 RepID=UPI001F47ECF7|nr:gas vesicle protein GvpJ [Streptomyces sp. JJ36]MCF6525391.1 gas vesicle structural protein GvpA [Streptomyces sp. JJ36]